MQAAIGTLSEQLQELNQLLAPGDGLPEHLQGLIEGRPPLPAGAVAARLLRRRSLLEERVFHAQLRTNSKKIQELVHINLGLSQ